MNINEWSYVFLNKLEKFYKREDFILNYDEVLDRIGAAVCFPPTCVNFLYLSNDFKRILNGCWGLSNSDYRTRCELEIHRNVLWFANNIYLGSHLCNVGCISQTHYAELNHSFVKEAKCIFLRGKIIDNKESRRRMKEENKTFKVVILPIENNMNDHDNISDYDPNNTPFFEKAISPTRVTEGSVCQI